jgi:cardiolipin synthase
VTAKCKKNARNEEALRLLQQPGDGITPLVRGITSAKKSVEILIFRFDQREIERALASAVVRGVVVQALIAHTNGSGGESLRSLETRLLAAGVNVARTDNVLARYHAKLMIVDGLELYVLAFNFTNQDINRSRSFGLIVEDRQLVQEASRLFEADVTRQSFEPAVTGFVVSPLNARQQLGAFLEGAKSELLIYDPKISDPEMLRILHSRRQNGVDIKVIGRVSSSGSSLTARSLSGLRLHTRTIIRDRQQAFVGSQSLRELELDGRREVGIITADPEVVSQLAKTFQADWEPAQENVAAREIENTVTPPAVAAAKVAKKVAKAVSKSMVPVAPLLEETIKVVAGEQTELTLDAEELESSVRTAVKDAVKKAVREAVEAGTADA